MGLVEIFFNGLNEVARTAANAVPGPYTESERRLRALELNTNPVLMVILAKLMREDDDFFYTMRILQNLLLFQRSAVSTHYQPIRGIKLNITRDELIIHVRDPEHITELEALARLQSIEDPNVIIFPFTKEGPTILGKMLVDGRRDLGICVVVTHLALKEKQKMDFNTEIHLNISPSTLVKLYLHNRNEFNDLLKIWAKNKIKIEMTEMSRLLEDEVFLINNSDIEEFLGDSKRCKKLVKHCVEKGVKFALDDIIGSQIEVAFVEGGATCVKVCLGSVGDTIKEIAKSNVPFAKKTQNIKRYLTGLRNVLNALAKQCTENQKPGTIVLERPLGHDAPGGAGFTAILYRAIFSRETLRAIRSESLFLEAQDYEFGRTEALDVVLNASVARTVSKKFNNASAPGRLSLRNCAERFLGLFDVNPSSAPNDDNYALAA